MHKIINVIFEAEMKKLGDYYNNLSIEASPYQSFVLHHHQLVILIKLFSLKVHPIHRFQKMILIPLQDLVKLVVSIIKHVN